MHASPAILLSAASAALVRVAAAEELDASDVPSACSAICAPIVALTGICDVDPESGSGSGSNRKAVLSADGQLASSEVPNKSSRLRKKRQEDGSDGGEGDDEIVDDDDEALESQCVCGNDSFDVNMVGAYCAGCLGANGGIDQDMSTIMSQCGFSTSSYDPSVTAVVANVTVVATRPTLTAAGTGTAAGATGAAGEGGGADSEGVGLGLGGGRTAGWLTGAGIAFALLLL
ncbi:hypothetical protein MKZ38_008496 [Zalerion maritima]|uniref:Uncharacterized protein n=1 Tax=Zalerion maritima TaxID=339359 RepID=A0AAD5RHH0_9PEZI|nr:hypothetical protein MKZ38_008496 [Zalerion maritima]